MTQSKKIWPDLAKLLEQIKGLSAVNQTKLADYIAFLTWQEAQQHPARANSWSFSLIEGFKEASVQASDNSAGMDVKLAPALVGGIEKPALWAHPPLSGQAIIEYYIPIPQQISNIRLQLTFGIRDGAEIDEANLVAFSVRLNGIRVWGQQTNAQRWQAVDLPLDTLSGDMARLELTTETLGRHEWTWAVWGQPELVGR